ncbi:MAG: M48 family metallopeptidase, partial [Gemmataceae bacterium]|nr:M48 family metallopeptidase [Gemmataceae bacterium]
GLLARAAPILIALVVAAVFAFKGCEDGPFGRKQVVALGLPEESRMGAQAFQQVLREQQGNIVTDQAVNAAVRRVADRLIAAAENPAFLSAVKLEKRDFEWGLRVVRSREVNAFCLPGGKIVVYTGILPVCQTEAGLAVVMGHEIAHALARHGSERMAQQQLVNIGQMGAMGSISDMDAASRQRVMMLINAGAKFGILSYSRSHETEADHLGLYLMAVAGYDPGEAPKFWLRMQQATGAGGRPPEFMSTHPSHERRIAELQGWQSEVRNLYERSNKAVDGDRRLPGS